jgi:hypothetical protein
MDLAEGRKAFNLQIILTGKATRENEYESQVGWSLL